MCDERGLSISAPPPVLPIKDVKIDAAPWLGCDTADLAMAALGPGARTQSVVTDEGSSDGCMHVERAIVPRVASGLVQPLAPTALPPSSGHERGVFRPPR